MLRARDAVRDEKCKKLAGKVKLCLNKKIDSEQTGSRPVNALVNILTCEVKQTKRSNDCTSFLKKYNICHAAVMGAGGTKTCGKELRALHSCLR
eukprot:g3183.t1